MAAANEQKQDRNQGQQAPRQQVHELLGVGPDAAVTAKELAAAMGISEREVTKAVTRERRAGYPICAASAEPHGYYLAATREQMEAFCRSMAHRIREVGRTLQACRRTAKALPGDGLAQ